MTETQLQASIIKALEQMGVWVIRTAVSRKRSRGRTGEPGMPDLLLPAIGHGEVKLPGNDLDPAQIIWHERAKKAGVRVGTWHSIQEALLDVRHWQQDAALVPALQYLQEQDYCLLCPQEDRYSLHVQDIVSRARQVKADGGAYAWKASSPIKIAEKIEYEAREPYEHNQSD